MPPRACAAGTCAVCTVERMHGRQGMPEAGHCRGTPSTRRCRKPARAESCQAATEPPQLDACSPSGHVWAALSALGLLSAPYCQLSRMHGLHLGEPALRCNGWSHWAWRAVLPLRMPAATACLELVLPVLQDVCCYASAEQLC